MWQGQFVVDQGDKLCPAQAQGIREKKAQKREWDLYLAGQQHEEVADQL